MDDEAWCKKTTTKTNKQTKQTKTRVDASYFDHIGSRQPTVSSSFYGLLIRYVKLRVVHAPGMPETFSRPPTSKEIASCRSRHALQHVRHALAVMHIGIDNPWWQGKHSRHSRRMHKPQIYVSGKRPMG